MRSENKAAELRCHAPWREPAQLYYWHREARSSNAEVDLVAVRAGQVVPIEVKSGRRGGMQSLRIFMRERGLQSGVRTSLEPFRALADVDIVPLYLPRQDGRSGDAHSHATSRGNTHRKTRSGEVVASQAPPGREANDEGPERQGP